MKMIRGMSVATAALPDIVTKDPALQIVSDAAGRMRVCVEWLRCNSRRAVAVEEAVAKQDGVRVVHAYPRTGSVVVWYSPRRCDRAAVLSAISSAADVAAELNPGRATNSWRSATPRCCGWSSAVRHWGCSARAATSSPGRRCSAQVAAAGHRRQELDRS